MKLSERLEQYRLQTGPYISPRGATYGAFTMPGPCGAGLVIIACAGDVPGESYGWDHVSVSLERRMPNWIEMSFVKDLFWEPEDCVVQFHPPKSEHVNNHPRCLHMWRWTRGVFPMPPSILVGAKEVGEVKTIADAERVRRIIDGDRDGRNSGTAHEA
jgi:hypothetical protein